MWSMAKTVFDLPILALCNISARPIHHTLPTDMRCSQTHLLWHLDLGVSWKQTEEQWADINDRQTKTNVKSSAHKTTFYWLLKCMTNFFIGPFLRYKAKKKRNQYNHRYYNSSQTLTVVFDPKWHVKTSSITVTAYKLEISFSNGH